MQGGWFAAARCGALVLALVAGEAACAKSFILVAGRRDPRIYAHPDQLDLERDNSQSLVFAPGVHHCVGHLLAKMQLTEFFGALVRRF